MANSVEIADIITVLQWNCRSIFPKLDSFKFLVHNITCDVFALCETWLSSDINLIFHDFNIVRLDRTNRQGGGVLLGIRKCHSFYRVTIPTITGVEVVACQIMIRGREISIASVYIPPNVELAALHQLSSVAEVMPEPRLIVGDFNAHGTGWGGDHDDHRSKLIYDLCDVFNMSILNTGEATRIPAPPGRESHLDISLCSASLSLDCEWKTIQDPHGSDHLPIVISITNGFRTAESVDVSYDLTRNIDWQKFEDAVADGIDSREVQSPLEEYEFLSKLIVSSALDAQTRRVPGNTVRRRVPPPWWDNECTGLRRERSEAFKRFRKRGSIEHFDEYVALENKLKSLIKAKKSGYWRKFVSELSRETSMKTLWQTARRMRNRSAGNAGDEYSDRWIFEFARKVCPDTCQAQREQRDANGVVIAEPAFSMVEFSVALLSCNGSAPGVDRIRFNMLKNLPSSAKWRMLSLFNQFLELDIVPDEWREVRVIAIQKPGKPASNHNSYRPIAMLSCFRKLFEKMILQRLDSWVESNHLLSDTQYGFRRGKGTNDCLALLASDIRVAFERKEQTASVFLDIKGAFDSVSIEVLHQKLHESGLSPVMNNFLYNLLSKKNMNFHHGSLSTSRTSYKGLPQGSCLSPLLYNFYVKDIDNCLSDGCTLRQLADDGVVSVSGVNAINLQQTLQNTLDSLSNWAVDLGIEFSPEKTESVLFSRKRSPPQLHLQLLGQRIPHSMFFKYLGVWFDSKCTWGRHIRELTQRCGQRINFLRTITGTWWGAHPGDLIRLYQTTILSVLEYGSFCFMYAAKTHILKLERIQYRCLRIALGCMQSTHTMSLEVLAGVMPLRLRFFELSFRFLIRCQIMNPLIIDYYEELLRLNSQEVFMTLYYKYMTYEISPSSSLVPNRVVLPDFYNSIEFDLSMRDEIHGIPDHLRSNIAPSIFAGKFSHVANDKRFFTDGSNINSSTGFGIFNENHSASHKLTEPCSVYVAELAAIAYSLEFIQKLPVDHYFIFTDSLSSIEALRSMKPVKHSAFFLSKIKEALRALFDKSFKITLAWVPAHCSIPGNEMADSLAKRGATEGTVYEREIAFSEYFAISRHISLSSWQYSWSNRDLGRWLHSIIPRVSTKAWFKGLDLNRGVISMMSRLMSNHNRLNAHLYRINIAASSLCGCAEGYHDIEHLVWSCAEHSLSRSRFVDNLRTRGKQIGVPVRDILASRDAEYMLLLYKYIRSMDVGV